MNNVNKRVGIGLLTSSVLLTAVTFSTNVLAAGAAINLTVKEVRADRNGMGYVRFNGPITDAPPACSTHKEHLAFDVNTAAGRAIMSLALAAQASGKPITAYGTGSCDIYNVVESWNWGVVR